MGLRETGEEEQEEVKQEKEEEEQEKRRRRQIRGKRKGREGVGQKDGLYGTCPAESLSLMSVCKMSLFLATVTDTWEVDLPGPSDWGLPSLEAPLAPSRLAPPLPRPEWGSVFFFPGPFPHRQRKSFTFLSQLLNAMLP